MHSVEEVFEIIDASVEPLPSRAASLEEALGRVLGETVAAGEDQPALDRSAVDGFAVLCGSAPGEFRLGRDILPGLPVTAPPGSGEACRIFTGGAVPAGCGLVMVEESSSAGDDGAAVVLRKAPDESLIRRKGSSIRAGSVLLQSGRGIGPGEIALLASIGKCRPTVIPAPRILHLVTGSEIVSPDTTPEGGEIRDSNGPMIRALVASVGAALQSQVHVNESVEALREAVESAGPFDVLLVSGGSSVGKYDRTRTALEALGFSILVERVNSRPGKPMILARRGNQWAFGLPGNPVAHFAVFHVFVKRLLRKMAGKQPIGEIEAILGEDMPPALDSRETFWPACLGTIGAELRIVPRRWVDSGDLAALSEVNALVRLPSGVCPRAGEKVRFIPLNPNFEYMQ